MERLMYNRLIEFINDNDMLYEYQFGFQKGKSTYMALVILLGKISEALENGECVFGIFLDFFQGVWHGWSGYFTDEN